MSTRLVVTRLVIIPLTCPPRGASTLQLLVKYTSEYLEYVAIQHDVILATEFYLVKGEV